MNAGSPVVVALDGAGLAEFATTSLTVGAHAITADYSPDEPGFIGSFTPSLVQNVFSSPAIPTLSNWGIAALAALLATFALLLLAGGRRP